MPKTTVERIVLTIDLLPSSVRVTSAYHDYTGLCGVTTKTVLIPRECRQWKRRLHDLLPVHDEVTRAVRLWVKQLALS